MADTTIDLLKNSSYVGKMDELIAAVKLGGSATSDVEWNNVKNKPTTIGGYGITDAKIDNGTITLGNQTIKPLTSAPVTSVNSKTGVIVLTANDVGALPNTTTIPDKTSQLDNDSGYITNSALTDYAKKTEIPTALPNPNALTFTGAVTGSYDGSAAVSVEIPSGGDAEKRVRHIATVAVTTGTTSYSVTVDSNGDALNLESVYILTEKFWGSNGSYVQVDVNGKVITKAFGQSGSPQVLELEKMGELQKLTNIPKPSNVGISFGDYYNGKSAVTSVGFWSAGSTVDTTIEIYGVDA